MNLFKLSKNNTTVKQEFNAGLTTFLTMVYIVPVNAVIMDSIGMPVEAVMTATTLITIIACITNGLYANTPIALSVSMGLNTYFTEILVKDMGISWQNALGIVFVSALIFTFLSLTEFRVWVLKNIPLDLRKATSAGIGAFICFVGLREMGIIAFSDTTLIKLGNLHEAQQFLGVIGFLLVCILWALKIKGSFIISIIITALIGWFFEISPFPEKLISMPSSIAPIFFELNIVEAFNLAFVPAIITFFIANLFTSVGTITGVCNRIQNFHEEKNLNKISKTLSVDAGSSILGSIFGVSTVGVFAESASGVENGGRTGLSAVFVGILFVLTLFLLPFFSAIPHSAIYPILVIVGIIMFSELRNINYQDPSICVSAFLIVFLMPLTYSISIGLSAGFIMYFLIKLVTRQFSDLNLCVSLLTFFSLVYFVFSSSPNLFGPMIGIE